MKGIRIGLALVVLAVLGIAAGAGGSVLLAQEDTEPAPGQYLIPEISGVLPDLGPMVRDNLTMRARGVGHTYSSHYAPELVVSDTNGRVRAEFVRRSGYPTLLFDFYWNGEFVVGVPGPPVVGEGHIYTIDVYVGANGSHEIHIGAERQIWWCGQKLQECVVSTADRFWSDECIEASHDPEYTKLYRPGTGPACVAKHYVAGEY